MSSDCRYTKLRSGQPCPRQRHYARASSASSTHIDDAVRNQWGGAIFARLACLSLLMTTIATAQSGIPTPLVLPDATGQVTSYATSGSIDTNNPFFKNLGTNGRTCSSCHRPENSWTITPTSLVTRFNATNGLDPVFNAFDGTNCQTSDQSTLTARQQASSLLLKKGLIRIGMKMPAAEFSIEVEKDPYGCALTTDSNGNMIVSVYRRPLPSANVVFLSTVMWDGRENAPGRSINDDLVSQANDATLGHAQALASPSPEQLQQIVSFQQGLFVAQSKDNLAGPLDGNRLAAALRIYPRKTFLSGLMIPSLPVRPSAQKYSPCIRLGRTSTRVLLSTLLNGA